MFINKIVSEYKFINVYITKTFSGSFKLLEPVSINNVLTNVN